MTGDLQILILEDRPADAELMIRELRREGIAFEARRVATEADFVAALREPGLNLVLADYALPAFDGFTALAMTRQHRPDVPFILVSGSLGEDLAVEALHRGATDYLLKQRLTRLGPAVRRALQEASERRQRRRAEATAHHLEQSYRQIFDAAHDAIFVHDGVTGEILDVNQTMLDMFGYTRAEMSQLTHAAFHNLDPAAHEEALRRIRLAVAEGPQIFEWVSWRKQGEAFPTEVALRAATLDGQTRVLAVVRDITERKRAEADLRASEERYRKLFDDATEGIALADPQTGRLLDCNAAFGLLTGYSRAEIIGQPQTMLHPPEAGDGVVSRDFALHCGERQGATLPAKLLTKSGAVREVEIKANLLDLGGRQVLQGFFRDVTAQLRYDHERETTLKLLRLLNDHNHTHELIRSLTAFLQEWTGCEAVGVRLKDRDDFPYFETRGFPADFVRRENSLCTRDEAGQLQRDAQGYPILECMCGNILNGRFDPGKPFFTARGSFWTNGTTELLATSSDADRQARTRNRCNGEGYESVALFALRYGGQTFGLVQINDRAKGKFTLEMVDFLEKMADQIAMALAQRQTQAALRASEAVLKRAQAVARMGSWRLDIPQGSLAWSDETCRIFGVPAGSPVTRAQFYTFVHPEDRAVVDRAWQDALAGAPYDLEHRIVVAGEVRWVRECAAVEPDDAGQPGFGIGTVQDITERKRTEEEWARLAMALEQAAEGIVITDPAGRILQVNPAFEIITGYTRQEVLGQPWRAFSGAPEQAPLQAQVWETLLRGEVWKGRLMGRHKRGHIFHEETTISPLRDAAGRVINYVVVKRNITREVSLEQQFLQAQKLEAVGQLAGGVAHDFNNILAALLLQMGLLQMNPTLNPETRAALLDLEAEAERAVALTRQLLMFSRHSVLAIKPLDLNGVVANLLKMLSRLLGEQVELRFQAQADIPSVAADAGMVEQIVMNLAVNARDAMPGGGRITIATSVFALGEAEVAAHPERRPGRFVCLTVADTGCGMNEETRKRIFEPFFTTKEPGKGTGLGLATVHGIVAQHAGWVEVDSALGQGTTFRVYLPALAHQALEPAGETATPPPCGGRQGILLVEDEARVRRAAGEILRAVGYRVHEAENGREALRLWAETGAAVDLLITDMMMPGGMTGLELKDHLRAANPGLPVILSSGYSAEIVQDGLPTDAGVTCLPKPYELQSLLAAVRASLDKRHGGP